MKELLLYGERNCGIVILKGILNSQWYRPLFEYAKELFGDNISAYYYDLPFEETLARHRTKSNRDDFDENDMRSWWNPKDFIGIIPETVLTPEISLGDAAAMMYHDILA